MTAPTRGLGPVTRARHARAQGDADEVERILTAAVRVIQRAAPEPPRVSDIITEAGSCNKTFYRYFAGKDDLVQAVIERGTAIVARQISARMAELGDPSEQVRCWVQELLTKVAHPHMFMLCTVTTSQMAARAGDRPPDVVLLSPLRDLLTTPIQRMGRAHPDLDADVVFHCTMGTLGAYVGSGRVPPTLETTHLVEFCLSGLGRV